MPIQEILKYVCDRCGHSRVMAEMVDRKGWLEATASFPSEFPTTTLCSTCVAEFRKWVLLPAKPLD